MAISTAREWIRRARAEYRYLTTRDWTLRDVGEFWNSVQDYDEINAHAASHFRRFTDGYRLCPLTDATRVLDICCRTGNGSLYFSRNRPTVKFVCADVSDFFLSVCAERLKGHGVNHETRRFDAYPLPFASGEFDGILCFETVEHMPAPRTFVRELGRVIRRGGEMILTTPNVLWEPVHSVAAIFGLHHSEGPHRFIPLRRLRRSLLEAGFAVLKEETTVLVPAGPRLLLRTGDSLEWLLRKSVMPMVGLRRNLVCRKVA